MSGLDELFRKGEERDLGLETITNPFDLDFSYNFSFDNNSLFDDGASNDNVVVRDGKLVLDSGATGTFISLSKTAASNITQVHVKAIGEDLGNVTFSISVDNGNTFQPVTLEALTNVTKSGKGLRLRVVFAASTARVDAVAILYK